MCGRDYSTYSAEELELRYFNKKRRWPWTVVAPPSTVVPNFNMCPTQKGLVLNVTDGTVGFREMRWGLVPPWAASVKDADKYSLINARSEDIATKPSYKAAFHQRRCVVPLSGFFEWRRSDSHKVPFAIRMKDASIMSVAGVWESWTSKESGQSVESFALITTNPNTLMEGIHNRMPVILSPDDELQWIDPTHSNLESLDLLMKPCPSEWLEAIQVSTLVNSPRNNSPEVLRPV